MKFLVSIVIFSVAFIFFPFSYENETVYLKCEETAVSNSKAVENKSSLNDLEELLEVKKIIKSYLDDSASEKLENETINFLQNILKDIEKKIEVIKDS